MACLVRTMSSEASAGHVLLGGGTGFIGSAFKYLLNCNGYQVTTISRMPGPDRITWIDVSSKGLPKGITAVVNLAGQNILDPASRWNDAFKQNVRNSRIKTTRTLTQAIADADERPKVFISMSGVGVYKPDEKASYDEYSDVSQSFDFLSQLALEWEAAARLPSDVEDVRQVIVRSGIVLGRNGGMIKQIYLPFWFCVGGPIGSGTQFMPWIHIYDMCHILLFAIENNKATGIINGVAPQIITNSDFTRSFAGALHRPAFIPLPALALRLIFGDERSKIMTEGQKVYSKRLNELNYKFKYDNIDQACKTFTNFYTSAKDTL
nr:PREDICTED: epimerase family protein SDR39U1 [Bemisia tabaci]XP_018904004.1 PREDICTED: epimerase family protein SDR39U1 [Bemisia tabaci]